MKIFYNRFPLFLALIILTHLTNSQDIKVYNVGLRIYDISELSVDFLNQRPDRNDTAIKLCIPAAFTSTTKGQIDGLFVINGHRYLLDTLHRKYKGEIWGGLSIINDEIAIYNTDDRKLTMQIADSIAKIGGDFFEQFLLVQDGKVKTFNYERLNAPYIRRALALSYDGKWNIIESKESLGLNSFAEQLISFHVSDAIYLDMGSYGEGWIRDENNQIKTITPGSNSHNQTSWLIFYNR